RIVVNRKAKPACAFKHGAELGKDLLDRVSAQNLDLCHQPRTSEFGRYVPFWLLSAFGTEDAHFRWQRDTGNIVPQLPTWRASAYAQAPGSYERGGRGYVHAQSARRMHHPAYRSEHHREKIYKGDAND